MIMIRLNSKELRKVQETDIANHAGLIVRQPIVLILENIYDTYNIGGLFRLADALAVSKVYLCGETETPPNNRIHKASCGTYKVVSWEYCKSAQEAIEKFKKEHSLPPTPYPLHPYIIAIEQSPKSTPYTEISPTFPLALVVGNETYGVTKETLDMCDATAEIPMWGINKSLNVIISAGIVAYHYIRAKSKADSASD